MKYLCLIFTDEKVRDGLSEQESQALIHEALDFDDSAQIVMKPYKPRLKFQSFA
jgi:hypothetical protein